MKFGVELNRPIQQTIKCAKLAEKMGFDFLWTGDMPFLRDAVVVLAALARETKTARLGTGIAVPFTRHPAVWAGAMATLNELSRGRAVLGLSIGGFLTRTRLNVVADRPAVTIREIVDLIRTILDGDIVSYSRKGMMLKDFRLEYEIEYPEIPIYLGSRASCMLKLAGEVAQGVITEGPVSYMRYAYEQVRKGAEKVGRNADEIDFVYTFAGFWPSPSCREIDIIKARIAPIIVDSIPQVHEMQGIDEQLVRNVRAALINRERQRIPAMIPDEIVEDFAMIGDIDASISRIEKLEKIGFTNMILCEPLGPEAPKVIRTVGEKVIPLFKSS